MKNSFSNAIAAIIAVVASALLTHFLISEDLVVYSTCTLVIYFQLLTLTKARGEKIPSVLLVIAAIAVVVVIFGVIKILLPNSTPLIGIFVFIVYITLETYRECK